MWWHLCGRESRASILNWKNSTPESRKTSVKWTRIWGGTRNRLWTCSSVTSTKRSPRSTDIDFLCCFTELKRIDQSIVFWRTIRQSMKIMRRPTLSYFRILLGYNFHELLEINSSIAVLIRILNHLLNFCFWKPLSNTLTDSSKLLNCKWPHIVFVKDLK